MKTGSSVTIPVIAALFWTAAATGAEGDDPALEPRTDLQIRVTDAPPDPVPPGSLLEDEMRYRELAEALERENGPYDPQLGESLLSLGQVLQNERKHDEALLALTRALHIHRVNEGLQTLSQVPILESIIQSNVATENWDALDTNYHQLLWTYNRNYEPSDPALLPVVGRVGSWKVRAYTEDLLKQDSYRTIVEAETMYADTVDIMEERYGPTDPKLIEPLYGLAMTQYQLLIEAQSKPISDFSRGISATRSYTVCSADPRTGATICQVVRGLNPDYYVGGTQRREFEMSRIIREAGAALRQVKEIYAANPELPATDHSAALIHYGDWSMLMHRRNTAIEHYQQAIQVLEAAGVGESEINSIFGSPRQIPSLKLPLAEVDEHEAQKDPPYVRLSLDVTDTGRPRNVEIVESSDPDDIGARRSAKRDVRSRTFRPRFVNGEPVHTEGLSLKWLVKQ